MIFTGYPWLSVSTTMVRGICLDLDLDLDLVSSDLSLFSLGEGVFGTETSVPTERVSYDQRVAHSKDCGRLWPIVKEELLPTGCS